MPIYALPDEPIFPSVEESEPDGLLAIGGDLSFERLVSAYSQGIFPWYSEDHPVLWWSPDPRLVLFPSELKISKSLRQTIRNKGFKIKIDTKFEEVIDKCSKVNDREDTTWITNDMKNAYTELYTFGLAHSFETYQGNKLVGGLYGVSLGKAFFGESMFFEERDASKFALYHLCQFTEAFNFHFIDAQQSTDHMISLGAKEIERKEFIQLLNQSNQAKTLQGNWGAYTKVIE
jgi:leucyl/phenylalanyl-tRNA--protein transferase